MERVRKQQLLEQSIYGVIWSVIFFLPLIGEYFAVSGGLEKEEVRTLVRDSWLGILPFFMLFLLNNYVLVPYFLFKKKYWQYTLSLVFAIGVIFLIVPFPMKGRFPKEFRQEPVYHSAKESRRNQIIEMSEKARKKETANWELPDQVKYPVEKFQRPEALLKPVPFPYPPITVRYLIHFMIAFLMV